MPAALFNPRLGLRRRLALAGPRARRRDRLRPRGNIPAPVATRQGLPLPRDALAAQLPARSASAMSRRATARSRCSTTSAWRCVPAASPRSSASPAPGKSTLLLDQPSGAGRRGFIAIDGELIGYRQGETLLRAEGHPEALARHDVGMVFQNFNLFPHLTAIGETSSRRRAVG